MFVGALAVGVALAGAAEVAEVVTVETGRLEFHTAPLRSEGNAAAQMRQALQYLERAARGGEIVKLRAFVKDDADIVAVRSALVGRLGKTYPAVTVVQVGDLPRTGARVAVEAISVSRQVVNPGGLLFISGQAASAPADKPVGITELTGRSLRQLELAVKGGGATPADIVRTTAYLSSLQNFAEVRSQVERFLGPGAAPVSYIQIHRSPTRAVVEIEAVARLKPREGPGASVEHLNPAGLPTSPNYTQVIAVRSRRLALTAGLVCEADKPDAAEAQARETFRRLAAALESAGTSAKQVIFSQLFPVSEEASGIIRRVRLDFYDRSRPPASTMLTFQGAGAPRGVFVVETVAPLPD